MDDREKEFQERYKDLLLDNKRHDELWAEYEILLKQAEKGLATRSQLISMSRRIKKVQQEIKIKKKQLNKEIERLKGWKDAAEILGSVKMMEIFKDVDNNPADDRTMKIEDYGGVYIVSKSDKTGIVLTHFFDLIRNVKDERKVSIPGLPSNKKYVGDDGLEVDLKQGALIFFRKENHPSGQLAFRLANVEPSDETGQVQYEYALSKLGLGIEPVFDKAVLTLDGQFRKLLTDLSEGKKSS